MSSHVVVLSLAYAFVLFVLLLLLIRARLSWTLRLSVVLVATGFYLLHYFSLSELQGWPVDSALPEEFTRSRLAGPGVKSNRGPIGICLSLGSDTGLGRSACIYPSLHQCPA